MQLMKIPPKLAIINDISGYGHCSLTVALPVVSAMSVQGCPVPTSYFSNHMGYPVYFSKDLTEYLPEYFSKWKELEIAFDGIYCGFLSSVKQIAVIRDFIRKQKAKNPSCKVIVDPVMGDHGKIYRSVTETFCEEMKQMIAEADMITPNVTEACILTGKSFSEEMEEKEYRDMAFRLQDMGSEKIVITGIRKGNSVLNLICESKDSCEIIQNEIAGESRPGTGDLFSSIIAADAVKDKDFKESVKRAADFVAMCTKVSHDLNMPIQDGVCFENFLNTLTK